MSKKHGQRKKRRKASRKRATTPLSSLAAILNAAEDAGSPIRAWHGGILFCTAGLLLPPVKRGKHWEIRPLSQRPPAPSATTPRFPQIRQDSEFW